MAGKPVIRANRVVKARHHPVGVVACDHQRDIRSLAMAIICISSVPA